MNIYSAIHNINNKSVTAIDAYEIILKELENTESQGFAKAAFAHLAVDIPIAAYGTSFYTKELKDRFRNIKREYSREFWRFAVDKKAKLKFIGTSISLPAFCFVWKTLKAILQKNRINEFL